MAWDELSLLLNEMKRLSNLYNSWVKQKGASWTIARIKLTRTLVMRHLSGNPVRVVESDIIGLTHDGIPKHLGALIPRIRAKDPLIIRLVLTILQLSKFIQWWGDPDIKSIIEAPRVDLDKPLQEYQWLLPELLRRLGVDQISPRWERGHFTTKAGPMGMALVSAGAEARIIPEDLKTSIEILAGKSLVEWLEKVSKIPDLEQFKLKDGQKTIRKLSIVKDPEAKVRIIAIFDYWSQCALKPLHDSISRILRGIKADCTFNQDAFLRTMPKQAEFNSIDLKNCTDRLPALLQKEMVAQLLGSKEKAQAWYDILCAHEFYVPWTGQWVRYATGQGMGAYSSWTVMALTHHTIVQWAAMRIGYPHFTDYWLLGDDLVIMSDKVAAEYRKIISELGMEISEQKSLVSNDTCEFAKRLFIKGTEVSHWPLQALSQSYKKAYMLSATLIPLIRRGYLSSSWLNGPGACVPIINWFSDQGMPLSQAVRLEKKIKGTLLISALSGSPGLEDYTDQVSLLELGKILGLDLGCNREWMVPTFILELFASIKANLVRDRIVEIGQKSNSFLVDLRQISATASASQADYLPEDHPVFRVGRATISDLQGMLDTLRSQARQQLWKEVLISSREAVLFDPTGLSTRRAHFVYMGSCLVTLNKTKVLIKNLALTMRQELMSDSANRDWEE